MKERLSVKGTIAIILLLISFVLSACAPADRSNRTPEFLNNIGKTLSELKKEHPEGELVVKPGGFPDNAAICFGDPEAEYVYYFFGAQSGDAEKAMNELEDQLKCAGFLSTANILFPDMEDDMSFEAFFSLIGVDDYEYIEDDSAAAGWLRFTYHGMEVMVNTNEVNAAGGWSFTGEEIVKRNAPVSIVDPEISNTNSDLADAIQPVVNTAEFEVLENEDGSVTIERYIGSGGDVVIPAEIDGKPVSAIGNVFGTIGAFQDCTNVTSVVIPDGVVEIQDNAFYGCTNLEVVTVPSSVTLLRNCAFTDCPKLRAIYFEGNAPEQANYVFDATENVIIYYQEGTSGWNDPWYGCPTEQYRPSEISAGLPFQFAMSDVDADGKEKLVLLYDPGVMASAMGYIIGHDAEAKNIYIQRKKFHAFVFWQNGNLKALSSHNQTYGEMWPYALYRYLPEWGAYEL